MVKRQPAGRAAHKSQAAETSRPIRLWLLVLVAAAAIGCYLQTARYEFLWDDTEQIVANSHIRSFAQVGAAFQEDFWAFYGPNVHGHYYRPLQTVSYMIAYALGGLSPVPYHGLNILLHALASLAVVWVGWEMFRNGAVAFWGGLLFAVHPMHTESVAWVAGITDVGCGLFYCLSLAAYLRSARKGWLWVWLSSFSFLMALLFKEMALSLPVLAVAADLIRERGTERARWSSRFSRWSPLALALAIYLGVRVHALGSVVGSSNAFSLRLWDRILTILYLAGLYVAKLFLPVGQNAYRVFVPFSQLPLTDWAPPILLMASGCILVWRLRREEKLAFAVCWVPITLIPILSLGNVGQNVFAERYLYIPSVGFCILLAALAHHCRTVISPRSVTILGVALAVVWGGLTITRSAVWQNDKTLCTVTLALSPDAAMMHQNLGVVYFTERNYPAALSEFQAARAAAARVFIPSARDRYNALIGIGTVRIETGQLEDAGKVADAALTLDPQREEAYRLLGRIRSDQKRPDEAQRWLERALALNPSDFAAQVTLGSVFLDKGRPAEAERCFRAALALNPQSVPARLGLVVCCAYLGRLSEASGLLREILSLEPGNADALRLLKELDSRTPTER